MLIFLYMIAQPTDLLRKLSLWKLHAVLLETLLLAESKLWFSRRKTTVKTLSRSNSQFTATKKLKDLLRRALEGCFRLWIRRCLSKKTFSMKANSAITTTINFNKNTNYISKMSLIIWRTREVKTKTEKTLLLSLLMSHIAMLIPVDLMRYSLAYSPSSSNKSSLNLRTDNKKWSPCTRNSPKKTKSSNLIWKCNKSKSNRELLL